MERHFLVVDVQILASASNWHLAGLILCSGVPS